MVEAVAPVFHKKFSAPLAVSVVEAPPQIVDEEALTLIVGNALTVTVVDAFAEHPLFDPVTLYVVLADGLTVILDEVAPVLHKKLDAPLAVSVVEAPAQIVDGEALTLTVGMAITVIVRTAVAEHPLALVPVTLYVVVAEGLTTILMQIHSG